MRIKTSAPSHTKLAELRTTYEEFKAHWRSFKNMPFECEFIGAMDDVDALDFLDYKGLGYPESDLHGVALVWGNVLATQLEMKWATTPNGELVLVHDSPGNNIVIWPYARVLEVQFRNVPQFGSYAWLLGVAVRDLLQFGNLSNEAELWARNVLRSWEIDASPWS